MSAWLLIMWPGLWTSGGNPVSPVVVGEIESEAECHRLAVEIQKRGRFFARHDCVEYFIVVKS